MGRFIGLAALAFVAGLGACTPGYMKAEDLDQKEQGPKHCDARCHELGMRMAALVLVSNQLPGCVCQPLDARASGSSEGAAASTTSYTVIMAAAAAARRAQEQQRRQQMQQQTYSAR